MAIIFECDFCTDAQVVVSDVGQVPEGWLTNPETCNACIAKELAEAERQAARAVGSGGQR